MSEPVIVYVDQMVYYYLAKKAPKTVKDMVVENLEGKAIYNQKFFTDQYHGINILSVFEDHHRKTANKFLIYYSLFVMMMGVLLFTFLPNSPLWLSFVQATILGCIMFAMGNKLKSLYVETKLINDLTMMTVIMKDFNLMNITKATINVCETYDSKIAEINKDIDSANGRVRELKDYNELLKYLKKEHPRVYEKHMERVRLDDFKVFDNTKSVLKN